MNYQRPNQYFSAIFQLLHSGQFSRKLSLIDFELVKFTIRNINFVNCETILPKFSILRAMVVSLTEEMFFKNSKMSLALDLISGINELNWSVEIGESEIFDTFGIFSFRSGKRKRAFPSVSISLTRSENMTSG